MQKMVDARDKDKMDDAKQASETKLRGYCQTVYDALLVECRNSGYEWEGYLTEFVANTGVPRGWYTLVMTQLYGLRCVERLQTGTRYQPSRVKLLRSPSEVLWEKVLRQGLTGQGESARLEAQVADLRRQVGGLPIVEVLANFEERLAELERLIKDNTAG